MPFVIFEDKGMYKKASKLEFELQMNSRETGIGGPITGLQGKSKDIPVLIYPKKLLEKFDKANIIYKMLSEQEAVQYLSEGGKDYLENLKKMHPEFIV